MQGLATNDKQLLCGKGMVDAIYSEQIVEDYQFELEKLKKKQTAKQNMKKFSQT